MEWLETCLLSVLFCSGCVNTERQEVDPAVKPKIEIKNTSCKYIIKARDSYPVTSIECFDGNNPLKFIDVSQSKSSDGKTFSSIGELSFSEFVGNVTCNFTNDKVFRETRHFQVECKASSHKLTILESAFLFTSAIIFTAAVAVCYLLFKVLRRKSKAEKCLKVNEGELQVPESIPVSNKESGRELQEPKSIPESNEESGRELQEPESIPESNEDKNACPPGDRAEIPEYMALDSFKKRRFSSLIKESSV